jgi:hypothetical protein
MFFFSYAWVLSSRRGARVSCLSVFLCACVALRLIFRFASASPPPRQRHWGLSLFAPPWYLGSPFPMGPWERVVSGISRPEFHGTTAPCSFIDISPAPVYWIVSEGRSADVHSPLGRRPCVGTYGVTARKCVLLCRQFFRELTVLLRTPVTTLVGEVVPCARYFS